VVKAHARAPAALDEEQERRLLPERTEQRRAERHHEPHDARQNLMHLRQVDGRALAQGGAKARRVARAIVATLERDLERGAAAHHRQRAREVRSDVPPRVVARRTHGGPSPQRAPTKRLERGGAREP
jgi:hypothetical protein